MRIFVITMAAAVVTLTAMSSFKTPLKITSSAFAANGMIPAKYSCEGQEVSPPLEITGVPANARTLAIIVYDPDAPVKGGFTHWVIWNLPTDGMIPEGFKLGNQGLNGAKLEGYKGMCPPTGTHHYHFLVYALDANLGLQKTTDKAALQKAMKGHILAQGDLVGLYKKGK